MKKIMAEVKNDYGMEMREALNNMDAAKTEKDMIKAALNNIGEAIGRADDVIGRIETINGETVSGRRFRKDLKALSNIYYVLIGIQ